MTTTDKLAQALRARNASAAPAGAHTPEPWAIGFSDGTGETYITAGDHPALRNPEKSIAVVVGGAEDSWGIPQGVRKPEDARRIVACVNACAGIPTERVEALASEMRGALRSGLLVHTIAEAGIADPERAVHLLRDLARVLDAHGEDDEVSGADALDALTDLRDRARAVLGGAA